MYHNLGETFRFGTFLEPQMNAGIKSLSRFQLRFLRDLRAKKKIADHANHADFRRLQRFPLVAALPLCEVLYQPMVVNVDSLAKSTVFRFGRFSPNLRARNYSMANKLKSLAPLGIDSPVRK
jgi:hypothetical protein